jgi:hypothetical protein
MTLEKFVSLFKRDSWFVLIGSRSTTPQEIRKRLISLLCASEMNERLLLHKISFTGNSKSCLRETSLGQMTSGSQNNSHELYKEMTDEILDRKQDSLEDPSSFLHDKRVGEIGTQKCILMTTPRR